MKRRVIPEPDQVPAPPPPPTPCDEEIRRLLIDTQLRYVANASPDFWERWFFIYTSNSIDLFGKTWTGPSEPTFEILQKCRSTDFPKMKSVGIYIEKFDLQTRFVVTRAEDCEWSQAIDEVRAYLGMEGACHPNIPKEAQVLLDWARQAGNVFPQYVPKGLLDVWWQDVIRAVSYAQIKDPRLVYHHSKDDDAVELLEKPSSHLVGPRMRGFINDYCQWGTGNFVGLKLEIYSQFHKQCSEDGYLILLHARSIKELLKNFGEIPNTRSAERLFDPLRLRGLKVGVQTWSGAWIVWVQPMEGVSLVELKEKMRQLYGSKPLDNRSHLSPDASELFDWLEFLPWENLKHDLSPSVEEALESGEIKFPTGRGYKDLSSYIWEACEEINEKTIYEAEPLRCVANRRHHTRIFFSRKNTGPEPRGS